MWEREFWKRGILYFVFCILYIVFCILYFVFLEDIESVLTNWMKCWRRHFFPRGNFQTLPEYKYFQLTTTLITRKSCNYLRYGWRYQNRWVSENHRMITKSSCDQYSTEYFDHEMILWSLLHRILSSQDHPVITIAWNIMITRSSCDHFSTDIPWGILWSRVLWSLY